MSRKKKCVVTLHFAKVSEPCLHLRVGSTVWLIYGSLEKNISSATADNTLWLCHRVDNPFPRRMKRRAMGWKQAHMGTEVGGFGIMWPVGHFL